MKSLGMTYKTAVAVIIKVCETENEKKTKFMKTFSHYQQHSTTPPSHVFNQISESAIIVTMEHSNVFLLYD